jgi:hypothetical protein
MTLRTVASTACWRTLHAPPRLRLPHRPQLVRRARTPSSQHRSCRFTSQAAPWQWADNAIWASTSACRRRVFISQNAAQCRVQEGSGCDVDVDECVSSPCKHGAACFSSQTNASIPANSYSCSCTPGFAGGVCTYAFVGQYVSACSVQLGGTCSIDVNECANSPCRNGAKCLDSTDKTSTVPVNACWCQYASGYANGMCAAGSFSQYAAQCKVSTGGVYNVDISKCARNPCKNGARCTDSTVDASVAADAYRCGCGAGFANGVCAYSYIAQYTAACNVYVNNSSTTGSCNVDVNECASSPGTNGAVCSESTTAGSTVKIHAYKCSCRPGFSGGNCDADVDECKSSPCKNGAKCMDSSIERVADVHTTDTSDPLHSRHLHARHLYLRLTTAQSTGRPGHDLRPDLRLVLETQ